MTSNQKTESVTLRIPVDILEEIKSRTTSRRNRSQIIIDLLEQGLKPNQETEGAASTEKDDTEKLQTRLEELEALVVDLRSAFDESTMQSRKVLHRLSEIDRQIEGLSVLQSQTNDANDAETLLANVLQTEEEGDTETLTNSVLQIEEKGDVEPPTPQNTSESIENLFLLPEEQALIDNADRVNTTTLISLLRREQPEKAWAGTTLTRYRERKRKTSWHTIGNLKFKYAGEEARSPKYKEHFWLVVQPKSEGQTHEN